MIPVRRLAAARPLARLAHGNMVSYAGIMPGNFEQAESVVAKGIYNGQRFVADDLLVKCPSKYQGTDGEYQATSEGDNVSR